MQKNDLFEVEIVDIGVDGEGVGKYEGMTFFIKDACIGDVIRARVTKLKKNYGYARVEEVLTPSTFRVTPKCPVYRQCGGCQIQMLSYGEQLAFKQNKVRGNLIRLGGFDADFIDKKMLPIIGMGEPYRYRNKAQFPAGIDKNGEVVFGFYATRSHNLVPVEDCCLGVEQNREILAIVKTWMKTYGIAPYDETSGKGLLRHVLIRYGFATEEIMVCLIINGRRLPYGEELCERLAVLPGMTCISYNVNRENTNVILGERTECIWGRAYITDKIRLKKYPEPGCVQPFQETGISVSYHISPQSFYQVNPVQTEKLYSIALEFAKLTGTESVWDLYCGIGTISLFLAQKARKVYGVEIVPRAIEDARNNARLNGIMNAEFFVGKAEEVLPEFYERMSREMAGEGADMLRPDVIVVDPPRKGCDEKCLDTMIRMQPDRIVYVSCDSATLARDLRVLCDGGYEIRRIQAVDQFCHTVHVETCVLLSKLKSTKHIEVALDEMDRSDNPYVYQNVRIFLHSQVSQPHGSAER